MLNSDTKNEVVYKSETCKADDWSCLSMFASVASRLQQEDFVDKETSHPPSEQLTPISFTYCRFSMLASVASLLRPLENETSHPPSEQPTVRIETSHPPSEQPIVENEITQPPSEQPSPISQETNFPKECSKPELNHSHILPNAWINRFSFVFNNEITKRYKRLCRFDTPNCKETFRSYGSEDGAKKKFSEHLKKHLKLLDPSDSKYYLKVIMERGNLLRKQISNDHDYFQSSAAPKNRKTESPIHSEDNKGVRSFNAIKKVLKPQFIIKNAPFPYICDIGSFSVAEIAEFYADGTPVKRYKTSICSYHLFNVNVVKKFPTRTSVLKRMDNQLNHRRLRNRPKKNRIQKASNVENMEILKEIDEEMAEVGSPNQLNNERLSNRPKKNRIQKASNLENMEILEEIHEDMANKLIDGVKLRRKTKHGGLFKCQICEDKKFTVAASLINHYHSHARLKQFCCDICARRFTRRHSLNYHLNVHHNRYLFTCDVCDRRFRHRNHFKQHMEAHNDATHYKCTSCSSSFNSMSAYSRHTRSIHKKK